MQWAEAARTDELMTMLNIAKPFVFPVVDRAI